MEDSQPLEGFDSPMNENISPDGSIRPLFVNIYDSIENIVRNLPEYVATFGWPLLITLVILYSIWPYVVGLRESISLSVANDPSRRKLFDEELKRARAMQQLDVYKSYRTQREAESEFDTEAAGGKSDDVVCDDDGS